MKSRGAWLCRAALALACPACVGDSGELTESGDPSSDTGTAATSTVEGDSETTGDGASTTGDEASTTGDEASTTADSTSTGATESDSEGPREVCVPEAFVYAPAPVELEDLRAVPIDIFDLEAEMIFYFDKKLGGIEADMTFQLGEFGGMPIFDLRQTPIEVELDGEPLDPGLIGRRVLGEDDLRSFRVLNVELEPCSVHTLTIRYIVKKPQAGGSAEPNWGSNPRSLDFGLHMADLRPGRFLEMWVPANMPWDRYALHMHIRLEGAEVEHWLITNGEIQPLGENDWQLDYPEISSADPLILIVPGDKYEYLGGEHQAANGQLIPYELYFGKMVEDPEEERDKVLGTIDELILDLGDFPHEKLVVVFWDKLLGGGMEYAGATTTSSNALRHEIFHSWWARGIEPANYSDGWIDEAWTTYVVKNGGLTSWPFDWQADPVMLFDDDPFARVTSLKSYDEGSRLFAGLSVVLGNEEMHAIMASVGEDDPHRFLSTAELERLLYCEGGEQQQLRQAFHRFVYGNSGEVLPVAADYCE